MFNQQSVRLGNAGWIKRIIYLLAVIFLVWLVIFGLKTTKKTASVSLADTLAQVVIADPGNPADQIIFTYSQPAEGPIMLINVERFDWKGNLVPVPYDPIWLDRFHEALKAKLKAPPLDGSKSV